MCRVLQPPFNSQAGVFAVHLQDHVTNFKSGFFRCFGVGEPGDHRQTFYHSDTHWRACISKIVLEYWARGAAMAVVDMGYHFSDREVVFESVLGSLHPRYELPQHRIPVLADIFLVGKEIIDDCPYAEG